MARDPEQRIAGAPISWGVCEVPGWGDQLDPHRVLTEMREIGLQATEFGPDGFLPEDPAKPRRRCGARPARRRRVRAGACCTCPSDDPAPRRRPGAGRVRRRDAKTLVLSADSGLTGYDARPDLDDEGWATLLGNLDRLADARRGPRGHKPCCTRTSGPWSRTRTTCSGYSTARASRCASTPGTC